MIDIHWLISDLIACRFNLQTWVNHRFKNNNIVMVSRKTTDHIVTIDGLKFHLDGIDELIDFTGEYQFNDITSDDIVLDLGANIGLFTIPAAARAKHVYAVEPLYWRELDANIVLNGMQDKITVNRGALGYGNYFHPGINTFVNRTFVNLKYRDRSDHNIPTYNVKEYIEMAGGKVDFLKVDVEGAEWSIHPQDLDMVPRIEFEAHGGKNSCMPVNEKLVKYLRDNWNVNITSKEVAYNSYWIHAYPKERK